MEHGEELDTVLISRRTLGVANGTPIGLCSSSRLGRSFGESPWSCRDPILGYAARSNVVLGAGAVSLSGDAKAGQTGADRDKHSNSNRRFAIAERSGLKVAATWTASSCQDENRGMVTDGTSGPETLGRTCRTWSRTGSIGLSLSLDRRFESKEALPGWRPDTNRTVFAEQQMWPSASGTDTEVVDQDVV